MTLADSFVLVENISLAIRFAMQQAMGKLYPLSA